MFGTQIIGDANNWPIIKAASSFAGLGVLSTDVYVDGCGDGSDGNALEWYINTGRLYSQIRNSRVDITATDPDAYVCAVHYQVAQATSIQNVELIAKTGTVSHYSLSYDRCEGSWWGAIPLTVGRCVRINKACSPKTEAAALCLT